MTDKELEKWKNHQDGVTPAILGMTAADLDNFIESCDAIIFEAKAKQQRAYREVQDRQIEVKGKPVEELEKNPRYNSKRIKAKGSLLPEANPSNLSPVSETDKPKKPRQSKKDNLADMLSALGINAAEVMSQAKEVKNQEAWNEIENRRKADEQKKLANTPAAKVSESEDCPYSPTAKHELADNKCKWCGE